MSKYFERGFFFFFVAFFYFTMWTEGNLCHLESQNVILSFEKKNTVKIIAKYLPLRSYYNF